jgi:hypothetical protein
LPLSPLTFSTFFKAKTSFAFAAFPFWLPMKTCSQQFTFFASMLWFLSSPRNFGRAKEKDIFKHVHTINIYFFLTFASGMEMFLSGTLKKHNSYWFKSAHMKNFLNPTNIENVSLKC